MLKGLLVASPVVGTALYFTGTFDAGSAYPRTVDGSPAEIMRELADLDVREQPGAPGSTSEIRRRGDPALPPSAGRGAARLDRDERHRGRHDDDRDVRAGRRRRAHRIMASVVRGDAPEAYTSPAFRSEGLTQALFEAALDTELNELAAAGWGPECDAIRDELMLSASVEGMDVAAAESVPERMVAVGKAAGRLAEVRRQLIARGCNPDAPNPAAGADGFVPVRSSM